MVIQIINITYPDIFKRYSSKYKIFRDVYQPGLIGLEIRDISDELSEKVHKIVLHENEMSYKTFPDGSDSVDVFIPGSIKNIKELSRRILASGDEDLGYKIANVIKNHEEYDSRSYKIGAKEFHFDKAYVMGILNITPDSFSDGGKYFDQMSGIDHAMQMIEDGADIIDIGGESSRPRAESISADEEMKRILPVIEKILKENPDTIISVDTTKKKVADAALSRGAKIINDISALTFEPEILETIKQHNASLVMMHIKGTPKDMQQNPVYEDVVKEIYDFLFERLQKVSRAGIKNIFIDPGIGFGKTAEHNFEILRRLEDFKGLGYPLLAGISRKSFLGKTLNLDITERDTATAAAESIAIRNGARIIRTHNVKFGKQVCTLLNNLL